MKEAAEHLVLEGNGLCGLLHLQSGLNTAPFKLLEPPLEVFDVFAPPRSRATLVFAVSRLGGRGSGLQWDLHAR